MSAPNPYQSPDSTEIQHTPLDSPESPSILLRTVRLGLLGYGVFVILALLVALWLEQFSFGDIYWPLGFVLAIDFATSEVLRVEKGRLCRWLAVRILVSSAVLLVAIMVILLILDTMPWISLGPANSPYAWVMPYLLELCFLSIAVAMQLPFLVQVRRELLKDEPA